MKIVTRICILLFCLTYIGLKAQTQKQNLQKYWDYKDRLTGKDGFGGFLDIGIGPGMSLAASERNPEADCEWDWYLRSADCSLRKGKGRLHWGDASLYHGFYLAILALEYANLEKANQPTDAVAKELWYALLTVERLDSMAEVLLGYPAALDGFFVRDDVRNDFHYKKESTTKRRFAKNQQNFNCVSSSASCGLMQVDQGGFISQDQVIGLFIGFSYIQSLVPTQKYKDNIGFAAMAALQTDRISRYMLRNSWKLKGPGGRKIPDKWGGNALGLSYPIATIANQITQKKYSKTYLKRGALRLGLPIFDLLVLSLSMQHQTNRCLALMSLSMLPKRSSKALARKSIRHDVLLFPLLKAVLFRQKLPSKINQKSLENLLDIAPSKGPCFKTKNCEEVPEWQSFNRWLHPDFKNGNPYGVVAETPGLDYMLLYNLYHFYFHESLPEYRR